MSGTDLMQNIIIEKPYQFVPPKLKRWAYNLAVWLGRRSLPGKYGLHEIRYQGLDHLRRSLDAGHGMLLASNHCRPCDPIVLCSLTKQIGHPVHMMASWHLFEESRVQRYLLQHAGTFSVYREGVDRESLRCAMKILAEGKNPLGIFPEGIVSRSNERLHLLLEGTAFLLRGAAKQRAQGDGGKVVMHPVFVRYFHNGDSTPGITAVLEDVEKRLTWQPQSRLPLSERVYNAGSALLGLKEAQYMGAPQIGRTSERIPVLLDAVLTPLEQAWVKGRREADTMARVKLLRSSILAHLLKHKPTGDERSRLWSQLEDLYLAQQLHCYPPGYLEPETLTHERLLETVERFEEDTTDQARPHNLRATVTVGPAIEATPERDRSANTDPLMAKLHQELTRMMAETRTERFED
jgi:hypothetical protein